MTSILYVASIFIFFWVNRIIKDRYNFSIVNLLLFLVSLTYISSIIFPMVSCHYLCTGHNGDAWMPAFFYTPIGDYPVLSFVLPG